MTGLIDRIGLSLPIIQAPMAGTATPALAAAVSNAGGLGSISVANVDVEAARVMIQATREATPRPFNVNLFCHAPAVPDAAKQAAWLERLAPAFERFGAAPPATLQQPYASFVEDEAMLALLVALRPPVISFHFGLPTAAQIAALRGTGATLIATATSIAEARLVVDAGLDAIVAQGHEAGGHRGMFDPDAADDRIGTATLTEQLARTMPIPIIAAGGIMTGAGIAAMLKIGASAAQLGTAFIGCPESQADDGYRAALFSDAAQHSVVTRAISGRPARCLANGFTAWAAELPEAAVPAYPIAYDAGKALNAAARAAGDARFGAQWAGQGAPLARALPAGELVAELVREMDV